MVVVTARDFRSALGKYFDEAKNGNDVVVKSRDHGSFKLVPISEDDTLMSKEAFFAKIEQALNEVQEKKTFKMYPGESLDDFLARMEIEGNVQHWVH